MPTSVKSINSQVLRIFVLQTALIIITAILVGLAMGEENKIADEQEDKLDEMMINSDSLLLAADSLGFAEIKIVEKGSHDRKKKKSKIGFFWFSFLAGIFGSSIALLRRVQESDIPQPLKSTTIQHSISRQWFRNFVDYLRSWMPTLMPFLYGGMMGAVTYFLFISQILSGVEGNGLIAFNLFPDFYIPEKSASEATGVDFMDWQYFRPKDLANAGKLIVWTFLAGYSESFVTGILGQLEKRTGEEGEETA